MPMRSPRPQFDLSQPQFFPLSNKLSCLGSALKESGRVATVILAGGEGSRLGLGPKALLKGAFSESEEVSLVEHLLKEAVKVGLAVLFVSPAHRSAIEAHVERLMQSNLQGLEVIVLEQKMWPYLDESGAEVYDLNQKRIEGPRGNGEVFARLESEGLLGVFEKHGIEFIQILPIDNPKSSRFVDALLGSAVKSKSDVVFTAFDKGAKKNVGLLAEEGGGIKVCEYVSLDHREAQHLHLANAGIYVISLSACRRASKQRLTRYCVPKTKEVDGVSRILTKQETFIFEAFERESATCVVKICLKNHYGAIKTPEDLAAFS